MLTETEEAEASFNLRENRWRSRRTLAFRSFIVMSVMAIGLMVAGIYFGPDVVNPLTGLITILYSAFASIVLGYMGVDAVELTQKKN